MFTAAPHVQEQMDCKVKKKKKKQQKSVRLKLRKKGKIGEGGTVRSDKGMPYSFHILGKWKMK